MDDDDVGFFDRRRKPSKPKSKPKEKPLTNLPSSSGAKAGSASTSATQGSSSAAVASSSQSAAPAKSPEISYDHYEIFTLGGDKDDNDDEEETVMSSSDVYNSDDSDAPKTRQPKRRKHKHVTNLSGWALEAINRHASQEPSSSSSATTFFDARSELNSTGGTSTDLEKAGSTKQANGVPSGRKREDSLTPPPQVSPEKKAMALDLVDRTMGSKFKLSTSAVAAGPSSTNAASASNRVTRSTRSSATPAFGQDPAPISTQGPSSAIAGAEAPDDVDAANEVDFCPELARLLPGEKNRRIREQAKARLEEKRKQQELERTRQQAASQASASSSQRGAQFARVQSAPQARIAEAIEVNDGNDTDNSVELVGRPIRRASASPRRSRSSGQAHDAVIVIDDSDDEPAPSATVSRPNGTNAKRTSPSPPPAETPGETLSLTIQSKAGSLVVNVTPTTLLSRLVQHFHEKKELGDSVKVDSIKISFDGEPVKQSQTVGDMGVEDEDQIDFSWS
ncbi:Rad60/SUMO-like domain protein [Kalmanozyma brasiliensis GHG001]|uniref:Rad60/SUMO-like domain protein n=1 Tax=Kalmanozyma brasiliensis (strain GHG001) TaxID=1365824 RepID=UPI0028681A81|nr:Rad60/SUMO-like domain protein [Kalmanozyma brasiliensis GHG001]KAF6766819.1 Rad60/SUMO-like domain protein [Kalmanozyma brasiliensis GHG001]